MEQVSLKMGKKSDMAKLFNSGIWQLPDLKISHFIMIFDMLRKSTV